MKERIILAPGLNGNELIKNLALNGINSFGTRIIGAGELARIAFMHSGISVSEELIDSNEQTAIIVKIVKNVDYFKNLTLVDIRNIASAINRMRSLVSGQDEEGALQDTLSKGIFWAKNNALLEVYSQYIEILNDRNAIDSTMLIRKAIAECRNIVRWRFLQKS